MSEGTGSADANTVFVGRVVDSSLARLAGVIAGATAATGRGAGTGTSASGASVSSGTTSCSDTITRTPIRVAFHNCIAKARGRRMQPCDAGRPVTCPSCSATPDQVMRCMKGIGAAL